ncbi:MAG: BMP family ABC transporter substrate-binding protein [Mogibacterium sp.]|nr:BMP family ABC transporter substrate-binding protein [Mogibacterium sp.]
MIDEYIKAMRAGEKEYKARLAAGEYPYLPALDDICPDDDVLPQRNLGLQEVPIELIAGTKTRARQNSFAPGFMPLLDSDTEFAAKWSNLYQAQLSEGFNSPIRVYEYLHKFYVQEGNKRVSVSRFLEMPTIMGDVIRIMPAPEVMEENPVYAEFLDFYRVAPIYDIVCEEPGAYSDIADILGRSISADAEPWPDELVRDLKSAYWRFCKVIRTLQGKVPGMALGDAFVVYLRIFTADTLGQPDKEVEKRLKRIRHELLIAHNKDKVSLVESSDEAVNAGGLITKAEKLVTGPDSLLSKVLPAVTYSRKNPLKAAFIYDKDPDASNWFFDHEKGRRDLEQTYDGIVATERFIISGAGEDDESNIYASFDDAADAAVKWGADVVFTPSVRQMDDTLRAAIKYSDVKFLNCSINLAHHAVRTYFAKLYEAKFLAGLVAGAASAADGTHRIGYCSGMPVYGTVACINAFAIGAAMTDPEVRIQLDWATKQDANWWWNMVNDGIHVLSAVDSLHNTDGSSAYGICRVERCEPGQGNDLSGSCLITNLAAPVYKWGKLYEIIVRTIIEGTYSASAVDKKDRATNYWWGMISGVVDIELSDAISPYTRKLVEILRRNIIGGNFNPFDGELRSQEGIVRHEYDAPLTSMDVIKMDWLNENIIGEIPKIDTLDDEAKATVKYSGVGKSKTGVR